MAPPVEEEKKNPVSGREKQRRNQSQEGSQREDGQFASSFESLDEREVLPVVLIVDDEPSNVEVLKD